MTTDPIADTRALLKMGVNTSRLACRLAQQLLDNPNSPPTPEMLEVAQVIAHPTPEHQPMLLAVADAREAA